MVEPTHEETNIPTRNMNTREVKKPRPNMSIPSFAYKGLKNPSTN